VVTVQRRRRPIEPGSALLAGWGMTQPCLAAISTVGPTAQDFKVGVHAENGRRPFLSVNKSKRSPSAPFS
jgi:hypothetical protein